MQFKVLDHDLLELAGDLAVVLDLLLSSLDDLSGTKHVICRLRVLFKVINHGLPELTDDGAVVLDLLLGRLEDLPGTKTGHLLI